MYLFTVVRCTRLGYPAVFTRCVSCLLKPSLKVPARWSSPCSSKYRAASE